jgi:methylene-tetrahydromethanopterin dehydrogenase
VERKHLLYLISSDPLVSPFDINMAYDAGFDAVIPYAGVTVSAVTDLVQDVMFSRGPKGARHSSIFFAGSDGYTTAAALLAKVSALAASAGIGGLRDRTVLVAAGTGGVGRAAAAMAARDGARVLLTSRKEESAANAAREVASLFQADVEPRVAGSEGILAELAADSDVVLATGKAGVRLLSRQTILSLRGPKILADVNAVPPAGIESLKPQDDGAELAPGVLGLGALAIGGLKFQIESSLLKDLIRSEKPPVIDSRAARQCAGRILAPG